MSRRLRNGALELADLGWKVIPLRPRRKEPLGRLVPNGLTQATDDLVQVLAWWRAAPEANVGLVAHPSGLVVLDIDPRHGGDDSLWQLEAQLGRLPETLRAETGGGGEHYLFRHPGGPLRGKAAEGVDVRDHAYIVAPPSIHPSGGRYEWDLAPGDVPLADLPEEWLARLRQPVGRRLDLDLNVKVDHEDPLRRIPAAIYVPRLTQRPVSENGWSQCPFHKGGEERTPSFKSDGTVWACYGCDPIGGRQVMGGNIYDLGGLLAGYPIPLRGPDFADVQARLDRALGVVR